MPLHYTLYSRGLVYYFFVNSMIAFSISQDFSHSWEVYSLMSIFALILTPQGRSLAIGSIVSNIAHIQAILGKRYNIWEPAR